MTSVLSILCVDKQVDNKYINIHKHVITSIVKTSIEMPSFNIIVFHYFGEIFHNKVNMSYWRGDV